MNNFPKPHTYNTNDINSVKESNSVVLRQLHKENTSPLPVIPKIPTMPKVNYYPPEWDKPKTKLPSLSGILSNHYYVIACVIFTSIVLIIASFIPIIAMIKAMWLFLMK
jgi:hypothetical protein